MRLKLSVVHLVVLAVAAVTLAGCGKNTVSLVYSPSHQKMELHPKQGDVLLWTDNKGAPITSISFPLGSPCASVDEVKQGQCTISVPNTSDLYKVPYTCQGCVDPEIVVGSDSSLNPVAQNAIAAAPTAEVQAACLSKQVTIYPSQVPIPLATVQAGTATVRWAPGGIPQVGDDWTTNDLSSICSNGPTFNKANDTCKLKTTVTGATNFTVSAGSCNGTSATGTITVQ